MEQVPTEQVVFSAILYTQRCGWAGSQSCRDWQVSHVLFVCTCGWCRRSQNHAPAKVANEII